MLQDGGNDAKEKSATEGNDTQPAALETAESYKSQGNLKFVNGDYNQAAELYTKGIELESFIYCMGIALQFEVRNAR